ncbi:MAG TPA: hypothetical protein VNV82_19785 [Bryobacteraceae bacterium]|nr:hypothetical protein [Bryobacteraceae bacterium]
MAVSLWLPVPNDPTADINGTLLSRRNSFAKYCAAGEPTPAPACLSILRPVHLAMSPGY